jgi:hypothetical protein
VKTGLVNEAGLCGEKRVYCELGVEGLSLVKYAMSATCPPLSIPPRGQTYTPFRIRVYLVAPEQDNKYITAGTTRD